MRLRFQFLLLSLAALAACPVSVWAAELYFGTTAPAADLDTRVEIGVFLNAETESVNAFEGSVTYPSELLKPVLILDADSIVSVWMERPSVALANGRIRFSGITPGGYLGPRGLLFSVVFQTLSEGRGEVTTVDERLLLNDGEGTATAVRRSPLRLEIRKGTAAPPFLLSDDSTLPELFQPILAQDPNIFDGRWFISFLTQDKGSGIDHYEIREKPSARSWRRLFTPGVWRFSESPAVLEDQALRHDIEVKAVDRAGNERVVGLPAPHGAVWYEDILILGILVASLIVAFLVRARGASLWRKRPASPP